MPIYEYFCANCQKKYEILIFSREEKICCPVCGKTDLTRLFSRFAFSSGSKNSSGDTIHRSSGVYENNRSSSCATCSGGDCSTCRG